MNHLESAEQQALFKRAAYRQYRDGVLRDYMAAIPNGGTRGGRQAMLAGVRRKAEGVMAGFPDVFVFEAKDKYHGLFVEMKRSKLQGGKPSDVSAEQHTVMDRLRSRGYQTAICFGAAEAWRVICEYIGIAE